MGMETIINSSQAIDKIDNDSINAYTINLKPITLNAGETKQMAVTVSRFFTPGTKYTTSVETSLQEQETAIAWWNQNCPSATAISVPDSGVQSIVGAALRNIFQARDIRKGNKSFHVGPTIYRGLWLG